MRMKCWIWVLGVASLLMCASSNSLLAGAVQWVQLDKPFTLKKGARAQVRDLSVVVEIDGFSNSPCPKGAMCVWSGLAVHLRITVKGKQCLANFRNSDCRYEVEVRESDYKTQALLVITDFVAACEARPIESRQGCLRALSVRLADQQYCGKLRDVEMRDGCFEDLAEQPGRADLCRMTVAPQQYCLYAKLIESNGLAQCENIIKFGWRVRCFKEIVGRSGRGAKLCDTLAGKLPAQCREYLSGGDH